MRILGFFCLLLLCCPAFAQDSKSIASLRAEADRYFEEEQFNIAIQYYRELADLDVKDAAVAYRLAECYMHTFNYPEAEVYYLKAYFLSSKLYPLGLYYYALTLKFNGNFEEAIAKFDEFIVMHKKANDQKDYVEQAIIDREGAITAREELRSASSDWKAIPLKQLNTEFNDYAPAVRDSLNVVVTSGRISSNRQSIDERFGEGFTDNFYFEKSGNTWTDKTKQVFSITNTRFNDGSGCFNSKGNKYYFTVCGKDGPQCRLFVTSLKDGKWTEPVALNANVNHKSSESKHPAVSHGGDTLIFSSNRSGGFGKFDLWMCINSGEDDIWGPAINLGNSYNTKLNELSPTFTQYQNVLFFASDGHEGYGGLDLYMGKRLSTGEIVLYNLGTPFNSNRDDCFVSFAEHELYWSSNRIEGLGGFDVMGVKIPSVIAFISRLSLKRGNARRDITLKSKTEDQKQINLQASRLEEKIEYDKLTYEKRQVVDKMIENQLANISNDADNFDLTITEFNAFKALAEERYDAIRAKQKGYLSKIKSPASAQDLVVTGILVDSLTGKPLVSRRILLTDKLGEVLKITRTNEDGKFRFTDVPGNQEVFLKMEKISGVADVNAAIEELSVKQSGEQKITHFENIYFDFDHYRMRPEATRVLDELANHLLKNPGVQLEIFAFADDRGTNQYNLQLTQKRGLSVAEYLAKKGVDQTGLAIVAKGRQAPREVDVDLQRQYNRRVEFYLNGNGAAFEGSARTYILKKKMDWSTLAQLTGIPVSELKSLNSAGEEQPKAFQPLRIPTRAKTIPKDMFFTVL